MIFNKRKYIYLKAFFFPHWKNINESISELVFRKQELALMDLMALGRS